MVVQEDTEVQAPSHTQGHELTLKLVLPKGLQASTIAVPSGITALELSERLQEFTDIAAESQTLFFQNGSRNSAKLVLTGSTRTLAEEGVEDGATVTLRINEKAVTPESSVLRQSIAKNGGSSYYYAHAHEKALPLEHRYVYGGAPAKLDEKPAEEACLELASTTITRYSWADEGAFVCIYISAETEAEAVAAAGDGKKDQASADFDIRSFDFRITAAPREFALRLKSLENEIVPEDSKFRVSAGKRVTIKLKKRRPITWSRLIKPL